MHFQARKGQALTEFAITLPVLMLLVLGTIQLFLIGMAAFFCHYAAHCAARSFCVYAQRGTEDAMPVARRAAAAAFSLCRPVPEFDLTIHQDFQGSGAQGDHTADQMVLVDITAVYPLLFRMPGNHIPAIILKGRAFMLAEDTAGFLRQHP